MCCREKNTLQNQAQLCVVGKQIFGRSSGPSFLPETGQKKSASGERLPGRRGSRPPTYLMNVVQRNGTGPSCESDLKANAPRILESGPVTVDKATESPESPVAVSTNMPVLEATHVPVKPGAGLNKSAGHCFLPEAEDKTSFSGVRPPGHQGAWSHKHLMEVSVKNITYPSCESDLNISADPSLSFLFKLRPVRVDKRTSPRQHTVAVSTNMPVPVKVFAGQKSISGERPPGHRGPRISSNLIVVAERNITGPSCECDLQDIALLSLPRLPSLASRPVRVDKRTSLCEHPVVSTNMSVLEMTCVPVKPVPVADPQKRGSVVVARNLTFFSRCSFDDEGFKMKRAQPPKRVCPLVKRFAFDGKKPDLTACASFTPQTLTLSL
ncbi:uncharacterized protein LOC143722557 [Siphateles boraxobius]|uniref:uncharacterized protein LOC143722557 n=1 Tax=Siphateles boraxobius TaxID=180520 RepID=UPI004063E7CE